MTTVEVGARLHFGFQNLSLAHERLYGGVGVALADPRLTVEAERSRAVDADPVVDPYVDAVVEALSVPGADVTVTERFGRHVGLGSGTQLALATLVAVAEAYDRDVDPRALAPALGRGGRSGVGVGTFEVGGFVIDVGHPTERFTTAPPAQGEWEVPAPLVTATLPEQWRFLLVTPTETAAPSGEEEDASMRAIVERADPGIADEIAGLVTRRILPAVAEDDLAEFGTAVARLGRLNGAWYADEQGGVYRPPAGRLVEALTDEPVIRGAGQSSWGPTVYGVTHVDDERRARDAAERALSEADIDGRIRIVAPRSWGHRRENDR
jgi:beta-ribofuranosylaminobenzene 5'-phosphate synthase